MENKPFLVYQAPVASRSGYGDHARDVLQSLWKLDKFNIKIISTRWGDTPMDALDSDTEFYRWIINNITHQLTEKPDIFIQVTVPNEFNPIGHYNIGITAGIETTACAMDWIHGCNRMDLIITPSQHAKASLVNTVYDQIDKHSNKVISQHRVQKPVEVLFEGYDEKFFGRPAEISLDVLDTIKEEFAFIFVGHWLKGELGEDRKNVGLMLKTFAMAFKNEKVKPALLLKTSTAGFSVIDREFIVSKIRNSLGDDYGNVPIYLLHGDLSMHELNAMYMHPKVKAMLCFTKGEGFGRPLLEFSLTGKPVITTNWSGHLDFLKNGAVLLDGELKNVHPSAADNFILKEAKWFNVNVSKAITMLKDVYHNYAKYTGPATTLAKHNKQNFSLSKMTDDIHQLLDRYGIYSKVQPKFQQLQLPKLKMLNTKA
jgi:glycosyltransferase involved in cell wall biosynthesis